MLCLLRTLFYLYFEFALLYYYEQWKVVQQGCKKKRHSCLSQLLLLISSNYFFSTEGKLDHSDYKMTFFQRSIRIQNSHINLYPNVFILDLKLYFSSTNTFAQHKSLVWCLLQLRKVYIQILQLIFIHVLSVAKKRSFP